MQPTTNVEYGEVQKLSEALLLCQRELAQVREAQEPLMEQAGLCRAENTNLQAVSTYLAKALAAQLSRAYWDIHQPRSPITWRRFLTSRYPWLGRLFGWARSKAALVQVEQVSLIESSSLFQPAWYLTQHADVALAGINPATHYLQSGASEGRDPGPEFNTRRYLEEHPECERSGINPLIHYLQSSPRA